MHRMVQTAWDLAWDVLALSRRTKGYHLPHLSVQSPDLSPGLSIFFFFFLYLRSYTATSTLSTKTRCPGLRGE
jgi:hypothetical protein